MCEMGEGGGVRKMVWRCCCCVNRAGDGMGVSLCVKMVKEKKKENTQPP